MATLTLEPDTIRLAPKESRTLQATARNINGTVIKPENWFFSENDKVADVHPFLGIVTGVAPGTTRMEVLAGGKTAYSIVIVTQPGT